MQLITAAQYGQNQYCSFTATYCDHRDFLNIEVIAFFEKQYRKQATKHRFLIIVFVMLICILQRLIL